MSKEKRTFVSPERKVKARQSSRNAESLNKELQVQIGYEFQQEELLLLALTHPSFHQGAHNNQRMEFLGDAVLELCISRLLYDEHPERDEGWMTRTRSTMVCEDALFQTAEEINLGPCLRMSAAEERNGGRYKPSILSDALEALICAVYLDGGWEATREMILRIIPRTDKNMENQNAVRDPKTRLQEWLQQEGSTDIRYEIIDERGQAHDKTFAARMLHNGKVLGEGEGRSKKEAEQSAALQALQRLQVEDETKAIPHNSQT